MPTFNCIGKDAMVAHDAQVLVHLLLRDVGQATTRIYVDPTRHIAGNACTLYFTLGKN